jgi:CelD/BcsL family acetyltransferase involved in cellulose biosynthesis
MNIDGLTFGLERLGAIDALRRWWTDLESRSDCSFFLSWHWIGTWLRVTSSLTPLLLSVRDGKAIVGLALLQPARLRHGLGSSNALYLHQAGDPVTDAITIEYNGILCDRNYAASVERSSFQFLVQRELLDAKWNEIHVALSTDGIGRSAKEAGLIGFELARKRSWFVDLDAVRSGNRSYLETISHNTRYQIRRAVKLYERHGPIAAAPARTPKEASSYLDELKQYHQSSWIRRGKAGSFANAHFEEFHRRLIEICLEQEAVELVRVTAGTKPIGLVYNLIHRGRVYAYQTGLCYEDDQRLKPGLVSHYVCLERHLERPVRAYDFMAGDSRYKSNLGIPGPDLVHHVFKRPTIMARGEHFLRGLNRRLSDRPNAL